MDVISDEWSVENETKPLPGQQEEEVEQAVEDVLRQHQRVQTGALVYRVLVVRLQLVKRDYLKEDF